MANVRKIINDPVYGFITIDHPLLLAIISHPFYQRLRSIHQMAFAHLVYPGAVHTRLLHSLGAYHLMCTALQELKGKGVVITPEEELGAKIAILLHDIGHGPFSHALEHELIPGVHHEKLSLAIMQELNQQFNNQLETALAIFTDTHPKRFLHQLVSGQLDVDRMDYLNRDSFFTGVAEGVIGYDRILKMLAVHEGNLVVEEKAIYSIEKFLLSRRLMYWQVYLHKTVVAAEKMLVMIIRRAKELIARGVPITAATESLEHFLHHGAANAEDRDRLLLDFCSMDDHDMAATIKNWSRHPDKVLSYLCQALVERRIMQIRLQAQPFDEAFLLQTRREMAAKMEVSEEEAAYFVFWGEASNSLYNPKNEAITILYKEGSLKDISEVDNALINVKTTMPVKKYYICSFRIH
ncbi:HD domain-containing protein [Niabella beijingensis]|uniref:HD domain-containing protein n=1 Tax=Niabella beijingensis TaxID=2872700 RepID=UPI001CBED0EC|nr:HD domain-containing protein [Niabella beijingensis]MBZ4190215.1 HD domain-containing protein [Niabella beijingensis]